MSNYSHLTPLFLSLVVLLNGCASTGLTLPWHPRSVASQRDQAGSATQEQVARGKVGQAKEVKGKTSDNDQGRDPSDNVDSAKDDADLANGERQVQQRRQAMMSAATARWRHGDPLGCERSLLRLLMGDPQFNEARMMLADVYTVTNRPDAAVEQLRIVLAAEPNNAQAHYSLGLVLESIGSTQESQQHLSRAAMLDPGNPQFILSEQQLTPAEYANLEHGDETIQLASSAQQNSSASSLAATKVAQVTFTDAEPSIQYPRTPLADEAVVSNPGPYVIDNDTYRQPARGGQTVRRLPAPERRAVQQR
jgi:Tfp pilus assembly protein PilF